MYFAFARFFSAEEWLLLRLPARWFAGHEFMDVAREDEVAVEAKDSRRIVADESAETQIYRADWIPDL